MNVLFRCICTAIMVAGLVIALPVTPALAQGGITINAVTGEPFGVGQMTIELPKSMLPEPLGIDGVMITDKDARVLYPVIKQPGAFLNIAKGFLEQTGRPVGRLLGELLGQQQPRTTGYFLFQGDEPLELTVHCRQPFRRTVVPEQNPAIHQAWLRQWWQNYAAGPGFLQSTIDYPPLVENYLKAMLAGRLGLNMPQSPQDKSWRTRFNKEVGLMLGTEKIRIAIQRQRMLEQPDEYQAADQPLPKPFDIPEPEFPEPASPEAANPKTANAVKIEPIAMRVPVKCLYVRFGSFSNFLWMQDTLARWNGDMKNLVARRGLDYGMSKRIERQLVLKQSVLSRMLGDTVVADVAIIGTDLFFREGAAFGMLFHARNSLILGRDFTGKRDEMVKNDEQVTEEQLTLAGKKISFLSSPDGSVRSFYAADGDFHFITSSKTLARRFLETASGKGSLGASKEFRHARSVMPLERNDTIFAYFSEAFGRNMIGPRYRIEMARRLKAVADIELAQMALLASATEGKPGDTIEQLVAGRFLPPGFDRRSDGSQTVLEDGEVHDSLRGHRGFFLPVPDVPLEKVSRCEARAYREFADQFLADWGRIDPMMAAIKREELPEKQERVVLDILANPFAKKHADFLSQWIGPADKMRLAPMPNDLAAGEVILANGRLFGGVWDVGPPQANAGRIAQIGPLRGMPLRNMLVGYIGTTGQMGFLSLLDRWAQTPRLIPGNAGRDPLIWRRQSDQFTIFSFHRDVPATVVAQLQYEEAERPSQIRLRVGDISKARLPPFLNSLGYLRTRETSLGNLRLMHAMAQQLHVPGPDCRAAAELLLDARLACPLGGEYVFRKTPDGGRWTSTALDTAPSQGPLNTRVPAGYQAPPLNWFRGLELDVAMAGGSLSAHAEIAMQPPDMPPAK